ncbi:MAG TPA: hypothetical protein VKE40_12045 [Gemmataceae bacterium]|nr:hypothetical protein [Gemmataceae bacterium]
MTIDREYLVTYGRAGFLSRFRAPVQYVRDDRVVVRSARGVELGIVLGEAGRPVGPDIAGDIVRPATADDEAAAGQLRDRAGTILTDAQSEAEGLGLPLLFVDGEILLDGREAILQAVHWADCDATPLFEVLSARHGVLVKLADLTAGPKPAGGGCEVCGAEKQGCDSCGTGGGCSSGSCSRGSVKTADDLTAYFAGLRRQMETAAARVPLH